MHLAAFKAAGESMTNPEKYSVNNINGSVNILNAAAMHKVKYIVFSSSAAVYGSPKYMPVDENHPTDPENYYGFTKLAIEKFLNWYDKLRGIRFAALRYFNAAGYDVKGRLTGLERNPANLIPVVMEALTGKRKEVLVFGNDYETADGTGVRDYIHVNDLARGHRMAFDYLQSHDKSLTVNLGTQTGASVLDIIHGAEKVSGKKFPTASWNAAPETQHRSSPTRPRQRNFSAGKPNIPTWKQFFPRHGKRTGDNWRIRKARFAPGFFHKITVLS